MGISPEVDQGDNLSEKSPNSLEREGAPMLQLTIESTPEGLLYRAYTEDDRLANKLRIDIYTDGTVGGVGLANNIAQEMSHFQDQSADPTIVWAADTTHTEKSTAYASLGDAFRKLGIDLNKWHHMHLDNWIYNPFKYFKPDINDFAELIRKTIINPLQIKEHLYHTIDAYSSFTKAIKIAQQYQELWIKLKPFIGVFGLGDIPEVHLAFMPPGMNKNDGYRAVLLSDSTIETHHSRGEKVPMTAITMGPANVRDLKRKFVSAFGAKYMNRVKKIFDNDTSNEVIAKMLLEPEYQEGVVFSFDVESAKYILEQYYNQIAHRN